MKILAFESSCDETAVAVVEDGRKVLSDAIASQADMHALYGGVVPEIASRKHVEVIAALTERALRQASCTREDIDAVAVTYAPGLIGAVLVGLSFAKSMAFALGVPLIPVHHVRGHIAANYLAFPELEPPFLALAISGGNTMIVDVRDYTDMEILGATRDDAAGECFDKAARVLGLPYPGGKPMDELAQQLGMTPWAFREKNLLRDGDISGSGQPMRDVSAGACLERLRREFGEDLRPFVRNGRLVGRGIACLYRGESYGAGTPVQDTSGVTIVLNADGSLNVSTGLSEVGQGGHTLLTAIIGRELGLPPERIHIAPADTDYCVDSGSTAASRGTITAGNAAWLAAQEAKQQINTALWEYRGFDGPIVYEDGLVRCGDEQMTFTEAVGVLRNTGRDMRAHGWWAAPKTFWDREKCRGSNYMSYAYGACGAEVEIDPITGKTDVTDFVAVHDMGRIINHAATVGQVGGGVSMGVGYALTENADTPGGVTRAADLDSYLLPTALDMCPVRTVLLEEGAGVPPLLVHGIGEPATSIVAPAITNAMSAALGARIDTLPADLETVRAILDEKKR